MTFHAGEGVGMVTKPGLPIPPGEPAINPVPRQMMRAAIEALAAAHHIAPDFAVTISVRDGARIAEKTWNPRLGIVGGLSHSGHHRHRHSLFVRGVDRLDPARRRCGARRRARLMSSAPPAISARRRRGAELGLPEEAYLDMGDFVGGLLKYLKRNPVARVTIAGGFAKMVKLAQGAIDLHSARGTVDFAALAELVPEALRPAGRLPPTPPTRC